MLISFLNNCMFLCCVINFVIKKYNYVKINQKAVKTFKNKFVNNQSL